MTHGTLLAQWVVGSTAYGTTIEASDLDVVEVYAEPAEYVTGLAVQKTKHAVNVPVRMLPGTAKSFVTDADVTRYGLRDWARLVMAGNPNMVETLFIKPAYVDMDFERLFLEDRAMFLSKKVGEKFAGFGHSQMLSLEGRRSKKTNRPEVIDQYGWDTKWGYHAIRVLTEGLQLMQTGTLKLPLSNADYLKEVRSGKYTLKSVTEYAAALHAGLKAQSDMGPLPDEPAYARVNDALHEMYIEAWSL